jgi:hypothetical protein
MDPKPLLESRDSLKSTGGPKAHKFTLNLDNKQKEIKKKKRLFTSSKII